MTNLPKRERSIEDDDRASICKAECTLQFNFGISKLVFFVQKNKFSMECGLMKLSTCDMYEISDSITWWEPLEVFLSMLAMTC